METKKIDIDLTQAYLREVQRQIEIGNDQIAGLEAFAKDLSHSYETMTKAFERERDRADRLEAELKNRPTGSQWHDTDEVPTDGTRCLVRTKEGATYFLEPVGGKWMEKVIKWMYIPE